MKCSRLLSFLVVFSLVFVSCKQKNDASASSADSAQKEEVKSATPKASEYRKLWKELHSLEKIHSPFIADFYEALNQAQKAVKKSNAESEMQRIQLPDTPKNWRGILRDQRNNWPDLSQNLKEVESSFEGLIGLNQDLKTYIESAAYKKDQGKRIREIADQAGNQVKIHGAALDELQVELEKYLNNNQSIQEQKVLKSEYLMAQQILSEMENIVDASLDYDDPKVYKKEFSDQYLNLKGILERAPIFPMPAPDRMHTEFEERVISFIEKMENIQKNFDHLNKQKNLDSKLEGLEEDYHHAVKLFDQFTKGAQA